MCDAWTIEVNKLAIFLVVARADGGVQLPPVTRAEEPPEIREEQLKRRRVVEALDRLEDRFERVRAGAGASLQRVELVRDVVVVDDEHANEFRTGRGAPGLQHLDGHEPGAAIHLVHGNIDPQPPFAAVLRDDDRKRR